PKEITTAASSEPFAAYGRMAEGMGKGYQWAEAVLRGSGPDGRPRAVSLGGFLCPGNAHPDGCLERLRQVTEQGLGRPRRRPDLLRRRLAQAEAEAQHRAAVVGKLRAHVRGARQRVEAQQGRLQAIVARQVARGPEQHALRARDERAKQAAQRRLM